MRFWRVLWLYFSLPNLVPCTYNVAFTVGIILLNRLSTEQCVHKQSGTATVQILSFAIALLAVLSNLAIPTDARSHSKKAPTATHSHTAAVSVGHHGASSRHSAEPVSHHSSLHSEVKVSSSRHGASTRNTHEVAHTTRGRGRNRNVVSYEGSKKTIVVVHRGRHRRGVIVTHEVVRVAKAAPRSRYAYPLSFFLMHPPEFERTPLPSDVSNKIARSFHQGYADSYTARSLVRAGIVSYHPLRGGIFWRREPVKYIIMHSTETGIPIGAQRVIESWSSSGLRHAGAQYVVDRDGTIFQAVDPDLGTVHINIFKTLPGINNDNSIGIEMCHTGHQDYPAALQESVVKLVSYLQERYKVPDANVITHRYAQQGDHTDPVNFDWDGFIASKNSFRNRAIAYKVRKIKDDVKDWSSTAASGVETIPDVPGVAPVPTGPAVREYNYATPPSTEASTYLQPHKTIKEKVIPTAPTAPVVVPVPEPTMILIPPRAESAESTNVAPVAPMVLPKNMPSLRGPIEMAPQAAPGLNTTPSDSTMAK